MMPLKSAFTLLLIALFCGQSAVFAQDCTEIGQTPGTAFPVCATTAFNQTSVPICGNTGLVVPGCSNGGSAGYQNKNPYWYRIVCYASGTLSFTITPAADGEDYDWQLYDITGRNPNDVFGTNPPIVTGNWAGTYGPTGASPTGVEHIECGSSPSQNKPTFAKSPQLIAGHTYLLMVSHYSDTQSGYALAFGGGTAVITDPAIPLMIKATPNCAGNGLTLKLNKKIRCNSATATGSEFRVSVPGITGTSAVAVGCSNSFDFDEMTIALSGSVPNGTHQLIINNGSDGNTLLDNCGNAIVQGSQTSFDYTVPQPIFADSVAALKCAPDTVNIYFPKKINCNTIAANGSDFTVTGGPAPVTVIGAEGRNCINGQSPVITVKFAAAICDKGTYQLTLKAGTDGTTVIDECGLPAPLHSRPFTAHDTVSAKFTYNADLGCRLDTIHFAHDGAHDVNSWTWLFNNTINATTSTHSLVVGAASSTNIQLAVSNGVCSDTVTNTVVMDNEVKAGFEIPPVICPEDPLKAIDSSKGLVDAWRWKFDVIGNSTLEDPDPIMFPQRNLETYYTIKQVVTNHSIGCSDSIKKTIRVLSNCFIAVPTGFTPNGDGLNEYLSPNNALKAMNLKFSVYNRWGQCVFSSSNWQEKWDGKINGVAQATGVYVWFLSYTHRDTGQKVFQKGTTTLIR